MLRSWSTSAATSVALPDAVSASRRSDHLPLSHDADAGGMAARDRRRHLGADRIVQTDQAQEHQRLLGVFSAPDPGWIGHFPEGECQHAQTLV